MNLERRAYLRGFEDAWKLRYWNKNVLPETYKEIQFYAYRDFLEVPVQMELDI